MKKMNRISTFKILTTFFLIFLLLFSFPQTIADNEHELEWTVELQLSEPTGKTSTLQFAESINGSDGKDNFDIPIPAQSPGSGFIRTYFTTNLPAPYQNLMKEVKKYRSTNIEKQWNFTVKWIPYNQDQGTNITISWDKNKFQNTEYDSIILQRKGRINNTWYNATDMIKTNNYIWSHEYLSANPPYPETWFLTDYFRLLCKRDNTPPEIPEKLNGPNQGFHGNKYAYTTKTIDHENNKVYYKINWDDSSEITWKGPYQQNQTILFYHVWDKPGFYNVSVQAKDEHGATTSWSPSSLIQMKNRPPEQAHTPSPKNNSNNIDRNTLITWGGNDPDGDIVLYDIYFGTECPPSKIISNQSTKSFSPILSSNTTYYWKIVSWDEYDEYSISPIWTFTTKTFKKDEHENKNKPPTAAITDLPQNTFINTKILFNASESKDDGYINIWKWNFGDGKKGFGEITTHAYNKTGVYTVELTVTDNQGLSNTTKTLITVNTANNPPSKPIVTKRLLNKSNKMYEFTVLSTDKDNDFIQYHFQWGDKTNFTTNLNPSNKTINVTHTWISSGLFIVNVTAKDNYSISQRTTINLLINSQFVNSLGYLIDEDNDGYFDRFFSNQTKKQSTVQYENNAYFIDANTDGSFDHVFNVLSGTTTCYNPQDKNLFNFFPYLPSIFLFLSMFIFFVYILKKYKRNN